MGVKITALPEITTVDNDSYFEVVDSNDGANKKVKSQNIPITDNSYQKWMEGLSGYDATADNQVVVRMNDGSFVCKIADVS